jgi:hypothetical protein
MVGNLATVPGWGDGISGCREGYVFGFGEFE